MKNAGMLTSKPKINTSDPDTFYIKCFLPLRQIFKSCSLPRIPEFPWKDRIKINSGKQRGSFKEKEERSERKGSGCLSQERQKRRVSS